LTARNRDLKNKKENPYCTSNENKNKNSESTSDEKKKCLVLLLQLDYMPRVRATDSSTIQFDMAHTVRHGRTGNIGDANAYAGLGLLYDRAPLILNYQTAFLSGVPA
jgi:hypothetical protein